MLLDNNVIYPQNAPNLAKIAFLFSFFLISFVPLLSLIVSSIRKYFPFDPSNPNFVLLIVRISLLLLALNYYYAHNDLCFCLYHPPE